MNYSFLNLRLRCLFWATQASLNETQLVPIMQPDPKAQATRGKDLWHISFCLHCLPLEERKIVYNYPLENMDG